MGDGQPPMEPYLALNTATVLLGLTALGGVVMTVIRLRGAPRPPSSIAMAHGLLAGAALTLLLYFWARQGLPTLAKAGTGVLLVAAAGGTWLNLQFHSKLQPLPIPVVLLHAVLAVVGFGLVLAAAITNPA